MEEEQVNPRLNSATGGIAFSAATLGYFLIALIASLIILAFGVTENTDAYVYINYLVAPVAFVVVISVLLTVRKVKFFEAFPVKCSPKYYLIAVLIIFGALFALSFLNEYALEFFKLFGYKQREQSSYFPDVSGGLVIPALLVMAVLPAVFEEALFRGVMLNCCRKSMGDIRAIFITAFCFSLFHGSPEQTIYQFIIGCLLAFVAVRSGSILPGILMHFLNNALVVIFQAAHLFDENGALTISTGANIALTVVSALCLVGGFVWLILSKSEIRKCQKGGVKTFFLFASVGIVIFAVIWILSLFGVL